MSFRPRLAGFSVVLALGALAGACGPKPQPQIGGHLGESTVSAGDNPSLPPPDAGGQREVYAPITPGVRGQPDTSSAQAPAPPATATPEPAVGEPFLSEPFPAP